MNGNIELLSPFQVLGNFSDKKEKKTLPSAHSLNTPREGTTVAAAVTAGRGKWLCSLQQKCAIEAAECGGALRLMPYMNTVRSFPKRTSGRACFQTSQRLEENLLIFIGYESNLSISLFTSYNLEI